MSDEGYIWKIKCAQAAQKMLSEAMDENISKDTYALCAAITYLTEHLGLIAMQMHREEESK